MYNPNEIVKFNVSGVLKDLNRRYHRNYTVKDVADRVGVTRETISRLTTKSAFSLIYSVAGCIYDLYPEYSEYWNFADFVQLLAYDDHSFIL